MWPLLRSFQANPDLDLSNRLWGYSDEMNQTNTVTSRGVVQPEMSVALTAKLFPFPTVSSSRE